MATISMLTTDDNPYSPFDQWDEWYAYDQSHGHYSSSLLARVAVVSEELTEADYALAIDQAIDEIVEINASGLHKKVTREVEDDEEPT